MVRDISRREMMNVCLNLLNEKEKLYFDGCTRARS